jgi:shikimate 5-dehydrogenase
MPHKVAVLPLLDEVDERARRIGAVNTIVRTAEGRLVGYNTDGQGGIDALTRPQGGQPALMPDLQGRRVLLIGAGGAGRALAVYVAEAIGPTGVLHIANRTGEHGDAVADAAGGGSSNCRRVETIVPAQYDLVVNASTVGQAGVRSLANGRVTCLEPFSPLAPSEAPELEAAAVSAVSDEATFYRRWMPRAARAVSRNNEVSLRVLGETPESVVFYDVIFAPLETTYLRHARWTGHRTLNGRAMSVAQAADGFFNRVCRDLLDRRGLWRADVYDRILHTMSSVW